MSVSPVLCSRIAVEGIAGAERQVALQAVAPNDRVEAKDVELGQPDRLAFQDQELDVDVFDAPDHDGVHLGLEKSVDPVEQPKPFDVTLEVFLAEAPRISEEIPDQGRPGEPVGVGGRNGRGERLIVYRLVSIERQSAHDEGFLRRRGGAPSEGSTESEQDEEAPQGSPWSD